MSDLPIIQREGETWRLMWHAVGLLFTFERVDRDKRDIHAELCIDSTRPDRPPYVLGPIRINLVSSTSQQGMARQLAQRMRWGKESADLAMDLISQSCAIVLKQFKTPSPTTYLDEKLDLGPVAYLVPGLIPMNETTFVYGDSESCKSMLALTIGMCAQAGIPLPWGGPPLPQTNVLILDWETNQRTMSWRLHRLATALEIEVPKIAYRGTHWQVDMPPLRMLDDELPSLREQVHRDNIGLVICDSIGFAVVGKLIDDDVARHAIADLRMLSPATRLVVAHISKESAASGPGRRDPFGSAFFRAGLRSGFEVRRAEQQDLTQPDVVRVGVFHHKSNDDRHVAPFGLELEFGQDSGPIEIRRGSLRDSPELASHQGAAMRIRQFLVEEGASSIRDIADALELSEFTVQKTLKRGEGKTFVRTDGGGQGMVSMWGVLG